MKIHLFEVDMIQQEKIDEIRQRANIVTIISDYLSMKRRGSNYVGLCPFHSENTPSFTVSEDKQIFYCFGCHAKGGVFAFLMMHENLSFPEAVKSVAERVGIEVEDHKRGYKGGGIFEILYKANAIATDYFHSRLLESGGERAREYLKERGVDRTVAEEFRLGYGPPSWDGLAGFLAKRGFPLDMAFRAGLLNKRDGGGYYDRFRERVIFPIFDTRGRPIAFGGRAMDGKEPKYLNSPDSPLFKKGETLYNLHNARQYISKEGYVLVVEGYFDLITLYRYGFKHTVATMGTALTVSNIRRLKGYAKEVYMLFDADDAGRKAVSRMLPIFLEESAQARVVFIPRGMDPDDFLKREGAEALAGIIGEAEPLMDFFLKDLKDLSDLSTARGKIEYLETVAPYLGSMSNMVERDHYAEIVAAMAGVGVDIVYATLKKGQTGAGKNVPLPSETIVMKNYDRVEEKILHILFSFPHLFNEQVKEAVSSFKSAMMRDIGLAVIDILESGGSTPDFTFLLDSGLDEGAKKWIAMALVKEDGAIREAPEKILEDCCRKVVSSGRLGEGTMKLIRQLEMAGKFHEAEEIRAGAESYIGRTCLPRYDRRG